MAKELPYFRFTVQDWQNGKISLESFELQGLFISVCGYYWINDCSITLTMLQKKFSNAKDLLKALIDLSIIKHENRHDKVEIDFLNIQYDLLSEKRKLRQSAGSKGGNAKAKLKQKDSYKDNNKDKDKDKDNILNISFDVFWNLYNKKKGSKDNTEKKWNNLKDIDRQKIIDTLPTFLSSIKDKQYIPFPETYLNKQRWNDELEPITEKLYNIKCRHAFGEFYPEKVNQSIIDEYKDKGQFVEIIKEL